MRLKQILTSSCLLGAVVMTSCLRTSNGYINYSFVENNEKRVSPTLAERQSALDQYNAYLSDLSKLPVSFKYGEKQYYGFGNAFKKKSQETAVDSKKITTEIVFTLKEELEIDLLMAIYPEYAAYEWTLYFTNISSGNSDVLSEVYCANMAFKGENPVIRSTNGDGVNDDTGPYSPYTVDLTETTEFIRFSESGRPTEKNFPYFNLEYGDGGVILAIGWPGQWYAGFDNSDANHVKFIAGQKNFDAYLEPGEKVRTPLMSSLYYNGRDMTRTMNLWRHWYVDCNMRTIDGELLEPGLYGATSIIYEEMTKATEENQIASIKQYLSHGIPLDYWWMDAGWYFETGNKSLDVWLPVGNWQVDTTRFPTKLKAISDYCAENNMKTLLWFEPELMRLPIDKLDENGVKPEWLLEGGDWRLVNYGNPEFVKWVIERVSKIVDEGGISFYRQDWGHGNPAADWLANDKSGRTGTVENHYVQGFLAHWDGLIERYPDMMIDTCASGGGRLDLETMRRSVPLHKTDLYYADYTAKQAMHQSLFQWFPYFGTNEISGNADLYNVRSDFISAIYVNFSGINSRGFDWDVLKQVCEEWKLINKYFYNDYYQLVGWNNKTSEWRGWEFIDSDNNEGFIQLFRPENSEESEKTIKLYGLNEDVVYKLTDIDGNCGAQASGKELMESGFKAVIPNARNSAIILISKIS